MLMAWARIWILDFCFLHMLLRPRGTSSSCLPSSPECLLASPSCCFSGSGNLQLFLDSSQCVLASSIFFSMLGLGPPSTWSSKSSEPLPFCCISLHLTGQAAKDACLVEGENCSWRTDGMLPEVVWALEGWVCLGAPVTSHFLYWPSAKSLNCSLFESCKMPCEELF